MRSGCSPGTGSGADQPNPLVEIELGGRRALAAEAVIGKRDRRPALETLERVRPRRSTRYLAELDPDLHGGLQRSEPWQSLSNPEDLSAVVAMFGTRPLFG